MNAPGSPSSPLQTTNFLPPAAARTADHLLPVGYPAPPRPLRPLRDISSMTCSGVIRSTHRLRAAKPSRAR